MSKLIVMTGPCCVDKSEFVRQMEKRGELEGYDIVCPEDFYELLNGSASDRFNRDAIWLQIWCHIMGNMTVGVNTIVDANAPTECSRTQYLEWFRDFDEHILIQIDTNYDILEKNNKKRIERQLSDAELLKQFRNYESPCYDRHLLDWDEYRHFHSDGMGNFTIIDGWMKGEK